MPKKRLDAALFRDWLGKEIKDFLKTGESQTGALFEQWEINTLCKLCQCT